ncbi:MAG: ketopantoate reductase family protein, partial [Candidatus Hydrogenedentales bacterium]
MSPLNILIFGAGAIGSVVGGLMAKAGHRVTLLGRDPHMARVREQGLRISGIWGEHHVTAIETATRFEAVSERFGIVLVTVKSYDTPEAAVAIASKVGPETLVGSYQNGLGNAEAIATAVGWKRTFGARAIYGVWLPEPGHAEVTVIAEPTALGVYRPEAPAARVRELAEAMNVAGLPTVYTDRIETLQWAKVAYNCALNPLSALLDVPYGDLAETEDTRSIMAEVVHELYAVGRARGVALEPTDADDYLSRFYKELLPPTAAHYASMREDFRRRRHRDR